MTRDMDTVKMSHEEMIDTLKGLVFGTFDRTTAKEREALDMVIKLQTEPSVGVILIPEGATNGEVIKAMFPNEKIIESDYACIYVGTKMRFDRDWWNASYQEESEDKDATERK